MKRVFAIALALALMAGSASIAFAADTAKVMGGANYKEGGGKLYAWCGYPAPCNEPTTATVLLEKQGPAEVIIGDTFSYKIMISNRSKMDMIAVNLEDSLPEGFAVESIDPKPTSESDGKAFWDLGTIPANTAKLITITGRALQLGCLVSVSRAKVCFEMPLPLATRVIQCNVDIQKTLPDVVDLCDPIPMCLTVFNTGSAPAHNVRITDELPEGLLTADGKSRIDIAVGTLPVGGQKTFTVQLKATRKGEFTNTACVTADRDCYSQSSATVKVVAPDLELVAMGPADGYICTTIPYQITVTNKGDSPAKNVILTDCITGDFKVEKVSDNGKIGRDRRVAWALGTLKPGESRTVCLWGSSTVEGSVQSEFAVKADCAAPKKASHCLTLVGVPGVLTSLRDDCDPIILNGKVTYTVTASNTGSRSATNLRYTIKLDEGMEFVSGGGATAVTAIDASTLSFAPLSVLNKGATASWTVTVKATSIGDKRFTAELMTNELQSPVAKSESTNFYEPTMAVVIAQ